MYCPICEMEIDEQHSCFQQKQHRKPNRGNLSKHLIRAFHNFDSWGWYEWFDEWRHFSGESSINPIRDEQHKKLFLSLLKRYHDVRMIPSKIYYQWQTNRKYNGNRNYLLQQQIKDGLEEYLEEQDEQKR